MTTKCNDYGAITTGIVSVCGNCHSTNIENSVPVYNPKNQEYIDEEIKLGNKMFEMKLHETMTFDGITVIRVHGGWIYYIVTSNPGRSAVFVPLDNEFTGCRY